MQFLKKHLQTAAEKVGLVAHIPADDKLELYKRKLDRLSEIIEGSRTTFREFGEVMLRSSQESCKLADHITKFYNKSTSRHSSVQLFAEGQMSVDSVAHKLFQDDYGWDVLKAFDDWNLDIYNVKANIGIAEETRNKMYIVAMKVKQLESKKERNTLTANENMDLEEQRDELKKFKKQYAEMIEKLEATVRQTIEGRFSMFDKCFVRLMEIQMEYFKRAAIVTETFQSNVKNYRSRFPRDERSSSRKSESNGRSSNNEDDNKNDDKIKQAALRANRRSSDSKKYKTLEVDTKAQYNGKVTEPKSAPENHEPVPPAKIKEHPKTSMAQNLVPLDLFMDDTSSNNDDKDAADTNHNSVQKPVVPPRHKNNDDNDENTMPLFETVIDSPKHESAYNNNNNSNNGNGNVDNNERTLSVMSERGSEPDFMGVMENMNSGPSNDFESLFDLDETAPTANGNKLHVSRSELDDIFDISPMPSPPLEAKPATHQQTYSGTVDAFEFPGLGNFVDEKKPIPKPTRDPKEEKRLRELYKKNMNPGETFSAWLGRYNGERALEEKRRLETAQAEASEAKLQVADAVGARLNAWRYKNGVEINLRTMLSTLNTILWKGANWNAPSLTDLMSDGQIKKYYRKAMLVVHPDRMKEPTAEQAVIAESVFDALQSGWTKFEASN